MVDFDRARAIMVENQLRTGGVLDNRILARMKTVPREAYLPEAQRTLAYVDSVQWLGDRGRGRFMPPPATLGKLLQLAEIGGHESVLMVGSNTGYSVAVVAGLADRVVGLEADAALARFSQEALAAQGISNAEIVNGQIEALGRRQFDVIIVEGTLDSVPQSLTDRLAEGGRLIALIRSAGVPVATVFVRTGSTVAARQEFNATLPPLFPAQGEPAFVF